MGSSYSVFKKIKKKYLTFWTDSKNTKLYIKKKNNSNNKKNQLVSALRY